MATYGRSDTTGAAAFGGAADKLRSCKFTSPADIDACDSISAYLDRTGTGSGYAISAGVYTDNAGSPGTLVANSYIELSTNISRNSPGWYTGTYTTKPTLSPNTIYHLFIHMAKTSNTYYVSGSANQTHTVTDTYTGGADATWQGVSDSATGREECFYITYTPPITGTGAVAFTAPALAASGSEVFSGTGAEAFAVPALAGSGNVAAGGITGTGAVAFAVPALAASGGETFTGTGAAAFAAPSLASSGAETFTGTGAAALAAPALAAAGSEVFTGTGAQTLAALALAASGAEAFPGTGAETLGVPALAASGGLTFTGTAAVVLAAPALAGSGSAGGAAVTGTGAVAVLAPLLEADGDWAPPWRPQRRVTRGYEHYYGQVF